MLKGFLSLIFLPHDIILDFITPQRKEMINFEKRRKEYDLLLQLQLWQASCKSYRDVKTSDLFESWYNAVYLPDEKETWVWYISLDNVKDCNVFFFWIQKITSQHNFASSFYLGFLSYFWSNLFFYESQTNGSSYILSDALNAVFFSLAVSNGEVIWAVWMAHSSWAV